MIHCNLKGGLGNILFQIFATISLSIENETSFNFPNLEDYSTYEKLLNKLPSSKNVNFENVYEYPFNYYNFKLIGNVYIDGFFQSEKYFKDNINEILKHINFDFIDKDKLIEKYSFFDKRTTSIHVRRGDYLDYPNRHPTQHIEYYKTGIEILKDKTDVFVIFSDDIDWCKNEFSFLENTYFIEGEKDYIDMYLMSMCNHNIICNSTFSWWGAWFNNNPNKVVIAPLIWFGPEITHSTDDIIPNEWLKIKN